MNAPLPPTAAEFDAGLPWQNNFFGLGDDFYALQAPTPLPAPYWVANSQAVAQLAGIPSEWSNQPEWLQVLSGNRGLAGTAPSASVYSGHQFGQWAGQLGDGRAILLGETGNLEIQLKGAGLTPFSRMGDGRAVLRSSIREFLCSEAIHGLGIPTTRALCVTGSDALVMRETPETAAVLTRVAPSFIRFGHFEHFCHHDQHAQLRVLADYVIERFYPECQQTDPSGDTQYSGNRYAAFLAEVTRRTADLVAQWQAVGFCHGVMNTDNMSILGLTIDYGPFQFLDAYDPAHICNHSDTHGRYAFHRQPQIAFWNLYCLGQALLPLVGDSQLAVSALDTFKTVYPQAYARRMAAKLGFHEPTAEMGPLVETLLQLMAADRVDFTIFWRRLSHWVREGRMDNPTVRDLFLNRDGIDAWLLSYSELLAQVPRGLAADLMLNTNPKYVLRNHLGELAIRGARNKDFSLTAQLLQVLESPFDEHPDCEQFADFPPDWAGSIAISCSS